MKIKYGSAYPKEKAAHKRALAAPQIFPLTGDGITARNAALRGKGRPYRGMEPDDRRLALVEARYYEWLDARGEG